MRCGLVGRLADGADDPTVLLDIPAAGELVSRVAPDGHLQYEDARGEFGPVADRLVARGVLSVDSAGYLGLRWPLWKKRDSQLLTEAADRLVPQLARRLLSKWNKLQPRLKSLACTRFVSLERVALVVIGCFGLDWGAIHGFESRGMLSLGESLEDGSEYLLNLYDDKYRVYDGLCSSRNYQAGCYLFTTFGENAGARLALPDLLPESGGWPQSDDRHFRNLQTEYASLAENIQRPAIAAGRLLEDLLRQDARARTGKLSRFLLRTGYIDDRGMPCAVVLLRQDVDAIVSSVQLVVDVAVDWIQGVFEDEQLNRLSPLQAGLPWNTCLMEVWHVIFGRLNRMLLERGVFELPPGRVSAQGCYTQAVTAGYDEMRESLLDAAAGRD